MKIDFFKNQKLNNFLRIALIVYGLVLALLVFRSSFIAIDGSRHFSLFDDAMISMRYADNFAHGKGLVWNEGQRVEGFTNPLMVFVMAGAIIIFGESISILVIQMLGILLIFANIWLVAKISKSILEDLSVYSDEILLAILLLTLGWYPVVYWSIFGMETGLLTTVVLFCVYRFVSKKETNGVDWLLALLLGATYLIRPDSLIFIFIFLCFRFIKKIFNRESFINLLAEAVITFVPIAGYHWFRHIYYHQLWPNTYVLKATGMDLVNRAKNGLAYFNPFLDRMQLFIAAVILYLFLYFFDESEKLAKKIKEALWGRLSAAVMFFVLFAAFAGYQIYVGGDPWPPFWRMTVPYTLLFFISSVCILAKLGQLLNLRQDRFRALLWLVVFSFLIFMPFDYHYDYFRIQPYQSLNNFDNVNQALAINELTDNKATVASFWAGTIPYYSHRISIDPLGKMDPYIARLSPDLDGPFHNRGMTSIPGHNKYDLNYSFVKLSPDVIQYMPVDGHICSWGHQNFESWCKENYQQVFYKNVTLLLKKDSSHVRWELLK